LQTNVLILTDDSEFARRLTASWRAERRPPTLTVVSSKGWKAPDPQNYDLVIIGPLAEGHLSQILSALPIGLATILCMPSDARETQALRASHPQLLHVPLRDDWAQTLLLIARESLRCVAAGHQACQALARAAQNERDATLGRYMLEMKHSVNNALTSILGNAELLLLEPGQMSAQSLQQIKTIHQMSLRLNEIMQRFSSLASEIRDAETASQPETQNVQENAHSRA